MGQRSHAKRTPWDVKLSTDAMQNWLGRRVRDKRTGAIGKVTADLREPDRDLLAVFFGPGQWNRYEPNMWSKEHLFELIDDDDDVSR